MPTEETQAITVDRNAPDRLAVRTVSFTPAAKNELTIRVTAVSLNRGEAKRAMTVSETGRLPVGISPALLR